MEEGARCLSAAARASEKGLVVDGFLGMPDGSASMRITGSPEDCTRPPRWGPSWPRRSPSAAGEILDELAAFEAPSFPEP